jgi:hypothetical protein
MEQTPLIGSLWAVYESGMASDADNDLLRVAADSSPRASPTTARSGDALPRSPSRAMP